MIRFFHLEQEHFAESKTRKFISSPQQNLQKLLAFLLGAHVLVWLLCAAGVAWWWKSLPYIITALLLTWGFSNFGNKIWSFNRVDRVFLAGFTLALIITVSSCFIPLTTPLATPVAETSVRKAYWSSLDQVATLVVLAGAFFLSVTITRTVPYGRGWMGFGLLFAITSYGAARIFFEKALGVEIFGTGSYPSFSNKNAFGHLLNLGFLFSIVILLTKSSQAPYWIEKFLAAFFCVPLACLIVMNDSRGGWVSLAISIACVIFFLLLRKANKNAMQQRHLVAVIAVLLAFVGAYFAPEFLKRFETNELADYRFRYTIWQETARQIPEIFLLGCGIHCFKYRFNSSPVSPPESIVTHAESSFLTLIYEQGVILSSLWVGFMVLHCVMAILQKNRSWRASLIGVAVLSLILSHGIYETLIRFTALNLIYAIFLGMLHGRRAWKAESKRTFLTLKPVGAALLGYAFAWGAYTLLTYNSFLSALNSVYSGGTDEKIWKKTAHFLRNSLDEFEKTAELTYAWILKAKHSRATTPELFQSIADLSTELLNRQPAEPLGWMSLAYARAASDVLIDRTDPSNNLYLIPLKAQPLLKVHAFEESAQTRERFSDLHIIELAPEKAEPQQMQHIVSSALLDLSSTEGLLLPGELVPDELTFPILSDATLRKIFKEEIIRKRYLSKLLRRRKDSSFFAEYHHQEQRFLEIWIAGLQSTQEIPNHGIKQPKIPYSPAIAFAKTNAIFSSLLNFYKEALGILSLHKPEALEEYYRLLSPGQQETLWAAWQRYLVYDPRMQHPQLLRWISQSSAPANLRLQAARMTTGLTTKEKVSILLSIFWDTEAKLQSRLEAADALESLLGFELWEKHVPKDIKDSFEIVSKTLISAYKNKPGNLLKHIQRLTTPTAQTPVNLILQTTDILQKAGFAEKALEIYRAATELSTAARSAKLRSEEIKRRITETGLDTSTYLGRLSVLSRTNDAHPEEILDFINICLTSELYPMARDFLAKNNIEGFNTQQQNELLYYAAKIAALQQQTEREIELHKQLLSR